MARRARKNERGLTLLETIVAMAIIFIVFLGLTDAGLLVLEYNINNTIRDEGVSIAATEMATVRQTPYATLFALPAGPQPSPNGATITKQIRGLSVPYTPTWTVTQLNADNLQVVVNVGWNRKGKAYNHQVTTIVRNGS
jgi:Flp pilus assembly protein TadG